MPMPDLLVFPPSVELADADARADALDIQQSWVVEAPAGSGKTGLLIQRFLKLLADVSVSAPEQVLAITFTTKATAEMRERVMGQLQSAFSNTQPANEFDRATRPLAEAVLVRDRELGWSLLDQPHRLNVRTIDSVCAEICRSLPVLSGSGGRRTPVADATPLYAKAARRTFLELGCADRDLHGALSSVLLHRDGNLAECEKLLSQMLDVRDQWGDFIPVGRVHVDDEWLDADVLPKLERALDQAICVALSQLAEMVPEDVLAQLATAAADMAILDGHKGKSSTIVACTGRRDAPGATAEDLEHWRALKHLLIAPSTSTWRKVFHPHVVGIQTGSFEQQQLKEIVRALEDNDQLLSALCRLGTLPPAKYPADQWSVAKSLFRVLNRALAELQIVFAERGECDFTEVALAARTALLSSEGPHDLEAALGVRLQHLLVDEMQDTSSSQYELIQTLSHNWDGHSQTVFLVGDPKQSIYLFRQARVENFLGTLRSGQFGEDLGLGVLRLTSNFRSRPTLVGDFNADFASIFPPASDALHPEDVPYVLARAARGEVTLPVASPDGLRQYALPFNDLLPENGPAQPGPSSFEIIHGGRADNSHNANAAFAPAASASDPGRVWHANPLAYMRDKTESARDVRAQRLIDSTEVCRLVQDWRSRPLPPGRAVAWKIAVLCRSRNHLEEIVAAFKAAAIPFRAVDIDPLKERPEVRDLFALTRALLHPADRVAWLAILHAPWCGLSLSDLHTLAGADDPAWARRAMQHVVAERGHLLPDESCQRLQRIWPVLQAATESRSHLTAAQLVERTWRSLGGDAYLGAPEIANSTRYLQLLDEIEEASGSLEVALLEQRLEKLYASPVIHTSAVDLLTIHKAKGLEWDVVIVPALERKAPPNRRRLLDWIELDRANGHSAQVVLAPIAGKGETSRALTKWIQGIHNDRETAEYKRLFYVACTRAREELHLFAAPRRSVNDTIKPDSKSLLAAAWPAASPWFPAPHFDAPYVKVEGQEKQLLSIAASVDADVGLEAAEEIDESDAGLASDAEAVTTPDQLVLRVARQTMPLKRLPLAFDPIARSHNEHPLSYGTQLAAGNQADALSSMSFDRPEGSIAARAFGNVVHAFLEQVTLRLAEGVIPVGLLAALPSWSARIVAALRGEGLQPAAVERLAQRVLFALANTLQDPAGLWLLSPHTDAETEYSLTAWAGSSNIRRNIRVDRSFRAGPLPLTPGRDHLWIVDYKTAAPGTDGRDSAGLDAFLASEKERYAAQVEAYAAVLSQTQAATPVRLALYYPLLARLVWWPWQEDSPL